MDPGLQVWPHQCGVERKDHLPWPAGNTLSNAELNFFIVVEHNKNNSDGEGHPQHASFHVWGLF